MWSEHHAGKLFVMVNVVVKGRVWRWGVECCVEQVIMVKVVVMARV